jgi:hypothetical protein
MRLEAARRFALSLPEVHEAPHFEASSFRVGKRIFCTVPPGGKTLHIKSSRDEVAALVAEEPAAYEVIIWGKREVSDWLRVHLAKADREQVEELLEEAWRSIATKRAIKAWEAESPA